MARIVLLSQNCFYFLNKRIEIVFEMMDNIMQMANDGFANGEFLMCISTE